MEARPRLSAEKLTPAQRAGLVSDARSPDEFRVFEFDLLISQSRLPVIADAIDDLSESLDVLLSPPPPLRGRVKATQLPLIQRGAGASA